MKLAIGLLAGLAMFVSGFACGIAYPMLTHMGIAGDPVAQAAARQRAGLPPVRSQPN